VSIVVAMAMSADILASLRMSVAGSAVRLEAEERGGDTLLRGVVPAELIASRDPIPLTFRVARTIVPQGGTRTLAVAVRELRLEPVTP